jgi:AraC-like DNA-binding protein
MTLQGDNKRSFDNLFLHLTSSWVPGQPAGELRAKAILHELLYEMVQLPYSGVRAEGGAEIVKSIKEELERDYASDIRLTAVALRHGISVSYLREMFHRYIGQSPKQYLDQVRYEHAKKRLIYTDLSIKEIGVSCGYADEYHFSKRFKQINGRPPLAFRKQHT